ncbi:zinc finger protein 1-like [Sitodiplosis mosellana]|uniref:zinc finger protein 1-like n=1 Tax=Sitodiplosis mosellana TaxID=263140 RepID=UPI002444F5DF|nr:zinc finger protein 1-like [Sitodiplosis mosellana]
MIRNQEEAYANSPPSQSGREDERKVRFRTAISEEQQSILKEYYARNPQPGREEFRTIAQILSLDLRVVQVWFQNNRSRERKLNNMGFNHSAVENMSDQPLDLSVKKDDSISTPSNSPRYGTAPMPSEEVINLSHYQGR